MTKLIPLTKGKQTIVSNEDYEWLNQWKWQYHKDGYAIRTAYDLPLGKRIIRLHRLIMNNPENMEIDHINGNSLDNRRENLRIVTHQQNMMNQKINRKNNTTGYRGVNFRMNKYWYSQIGINGKIISLGYFNTPKEAANAYNQAAIKYFGEFACLNKI